MSAQKFIELSKKYESMKKEIDLVREEMNKEMSSLGLNTYHQDPETLVVYKIVEPTGGYVYYKKIDYDRTIMEGEKRGSLSQKEAKEQGFSLEK